MARGPTLKRIYRTDLGVDAPAWTEKLLAIINTTFQALASALAGRLTLANLDAQVVVVEVNGDNPRVEFDFILPRAAEAILVLQTGLAEPSSAVDVSAWRQIGQRIEIPVVKGLAAATDYTLKLLIL